MDAERNGVILEAEGLVKEFRGFVAVKGVDLKVNRGSIHALIGPNGAGKTTCFNLLTKFIAPTRGVVRFKGVDITHASPANVSRMGLVRSFQISAVFPRMTALENVRVALQRGVPGHFRFWRAKKVLRQLDARAAQLLEEVGLSGQADVLAGSMPYGKKRALEIATTLALEPELMLLDEPTQGMGIEDVERMMTLIKRVAIGRTVLMVEHNMKVVAGISDCITVLARGAVLAQGPYAEVSGRAEVLDAYLGRAASIGVGAVQ